MAFSLEWNSNEEKRGVIFIHIPINNEKLIAFSTFLHRFDKNFFSTVLWSEPRFYVHFFPNDISNFQMSHDKLLLLYNTKKYCFFRTIRNTIQNIVYNFEINSHK